MPVINSRNKRRITFDKAYTSVSGSTYTLAITIPPFSRYKFTESSEQRTKGSEVSKTYTNTGSGVSGYIIRYASDKFTGVYTE